MQYPKMLYKGDQENYQTVIADDEDHEAELLADDWIRYGDLPEREQGMLNPHDATKDSSNPFAKLEDRFDALAEKLAFTEDQLITSQGEFIAFQNDVAAMKARVAELEPIGALGNVLNPNNQSDLTLEQLQAELDAKGIKYLKRDSKATLLELLNTN